MSKVTIITDVPWQGDSLFSSVGSNGWVGGAEQELNALLERFKDNGIEYKLIGSRQVTPNDLKEKGPYLIGNFFLLPEEVKKTLIRDKHYCIIENDFKFCPNRVPDIYPDHLVPSNEIRNLDFYRAAGSVFCLSDKQKSIFQNNSIKVTDVLETSFWTKQEVDVIFLYRESFINSPKAGCFYGVYGYKQDTKGTNQAIEYSIKDKKLPVILYPAPKIEFLRNLGRCDALVFLPLITESLSRITIEAYCLGVDVVFNERVSAAYEGWIQSNRTNISKRLLNDKMEEAFGKICMRLFS